MKPYFLWVPTVVTTKAVFAIPKGLVSSFLFSAKFYFWCIFYIIYIAPASIQLIS